MSEEEDWEKWADDDNTETKQPAVVKEEPKKQQQEPKQEPKEQSQVQKSEAKSKESDMDNVLDLFGGDKPANVKKIGKADLKKLGENFAGALNNVGPIYTTDFLTTLLSKIEKKIPLQNWQDVFKVVEDIYIKKRKQYEMEEAIKKKSLNSVPKGVSFGKTKELVQDDDDEDFDNDDDFM